MIGNIRAELVFRRHLPRRAQTLIERPVGVEGLPGKVRRIFEVSLNRVVEYSSDQVVDTPIPKRGIKPRRVAFYRTPDRNAHVPGFVQTVHSFEAPQPQILREVVTLQVSIGAAEKEGSDPAVATLLGNQVHDDSAALILGWVGAHVDHDLFGAADVGLDGAAPSIPGVVRRGPVYQPMLVIRPAAMDHKPCAFAQQTADIREYTHTCVDEVEARNELREGRRRSSTWEELDGLGGKHGLLGHALDVHHGRRGRDDHGFLKTADGHLSIHIGREPGPQFDALALHRIEPRDRKHDGIDTGWELDNLVPALAVCHDGADLFDEGRAGRFHRDTGHYPAGRICDRARNTAVLG